MRALICTLCTALFMLPLPLVSSEADLKNVLRWKGTFSTVGSGDYQSGGYSITHKMTADGTVELERVSASGGLWRGTARGNLSWEWSSVDRGPFCTDNKKFVASGPFTVSSMLIIAGGFSQLTVSGNVTGTLTSSGCISGTVTGPQLWNLPGGDAVPQPPSGTLLSADVTGSLLGLNYHTKWRLEPQQDVELILDVDPGVYGDWIPEAGKNESTPGNSIGVNALVKRIDGQPLDDNQKAKRIVFELVDSSRQPGIAMNFPIEKPRGDPDLQFNPELNSALTLSAENQKAETPDGAYTEYAAVVSAYDYGAWGEVRVTAELKDGTRLTGHLKGDSSQTGLLLPKRARNSRIADAWKQKAGVTGADDEDAEKEPEGLASCLGDGFTLYEEYRGFIENGAHIFGNPKRKDLFVFNTGGAEFEAGIWVFTEATALEVHKDLREEEVDAAAFVANPNWSDRAPHAVDQHAVWLVPADKTRINNPPTEFRGRPRIANIVFLNKAWGEDVGYASMSVTSKTDWFLLFERTVAHMLLHTVGVEHHGPTNADYIRLLKVTLGPDPDSTPAVSVLFYAAGDEYDEEPGEWVWLLDEITGQAYGPTYLDWARKMYEQWRPEDRPRVWEDLKLAQFYVAAGRGPHSGDEQCLMRQHVAEAYPDDDDNPAAYYVVPEGSEPAGMRLCNSATGTGINAANREPRSRHKDAHADWAPCAKWICVNDAAPLVKRPYDPNRASYRRNR